MPTLRNGRCRDSVAARRSEEGVWHTKLLLVGRARTLLIWAHSRRDGMAVYLLAAFTECYFACYRRLPIEPIGSVPRWSLWGSVL